MDLYSIPLRTAFVCLAFAIIAVPSPVRADEPAEKNRGPVLHLSNGDYVSGNLVESDIAGRLGWQSSAFTSPFHFALGGIASIHFPVPAEPPQFAGDYCIELAGGDMLFGSLVGLDADFVVFEVAGMGQLHIDRGTVQRICRWGDRTELLFVGPSGLNGWNTNGDQQAWREDAGHLISDKPGAVLTRDFKLPSQSRFEFELSWTGRPDFELSLGVGDDVKMPSSAFRFEVLEKDIVVQRETERQADIVSLQKISETGGRLHLQAFLDQKTGHMLVFSANGEPVAELTVQTENPEIFGGVRLDNRSGNVQLESLRIGRWNGVPPQKAELNKPRICANDGSITYGSLTSFVVDNREFVIDDNGTIQRISEDRFHDCFLSQSSDVAPRGLRAVFLSGMKVSGDLIRVLDQAVVLKCPGIRESVTVSFETLQSIVGLAPRSEPTKMQQLPGRFEMTGVRLHGCLVDGTEGETRCLVWHPDHSSQSSPLRGGISARIVYRDPPVAPPKVSLQQAQLKVLNARVRAVRVNNNIGQDPEMGADGDGKKTKKKNFKGASSVLHLRTGDTIPCTVQSIDERGVTFASTVTDATFAPNDRVQAVELIANALSQTIDSQKRKRLLTLPRMQRDNPPTHLVRSVDGDYLRGRLVSLDAEQLQIELRLESKIVRRERIVRIIWMHPELLEAASKSVDSVATDDDNRIQAIPGNTNGSATDVNRLTFVPQQLSGSILSGQSELLGACHVDLQSTDQIILGAMIEKAISELAFQSWKLIPSADPQAPREPAEGSGEGGEGQESALVGKTAPDISLTTLDGTKFQLSDHRQKVVVLDFWASWCGPCLQAMPQIDRVTHEFADQGVELFAVNLEESPEKVKSALERLKLSTTVVLDRDGRVAERYGATAIPQTVIIDREGTIVRLFVGGGARFDDQLRAALKSVLEK